MSMKFNNQDIGRKVAVIRGDSKDDGKYISISDDKKLKNTFESKDIKTNEDAEFIPLLTSDQEGRAISYIFGASGSGKSTLAKKMIIEWRKLNKSMANNVYLFSAKPEDHALDSINIKRIPLSYDLVDSPIDINSCKNSLIIFDDIDSISKKDEEIRQAVFDLLNNILQIGRSYKVSCIITNHLPNTRDMKIAIYEAHSIIWFNGNGTKRAVNYLLQEYVGMDRKEIEKTKKLDSRYIFVYKNYPNYIVSAKKLYLLD